MVPKVGRLDCLYCKHSFISSWYLHTEHCNILHVLPTLIVPASLVLMFFCDLDDHSACTHYITMHWCTHALHDQVTMPTLHCQVVVPVVSISHYTASTPLSSPFKACSRSVYSHTCYAYCQGFLPCLLPSFRTIHQLFFQNLSRFLFLSSVANTGSCVGPQTKIGHPAGWRFPC